MITVTRKKPTYESGISKDGEPLLLLPASKNAFEEITALSEEYKEKNASEQVDEAYRLLAIILNTNTAGLTVTEAEVNEIDPMTVAEIIKEYMNFMRGIKSDPN